MNLCKVTISNGSTYWEPRWELKPRRRTSIRCCFSPSTPGGRNSWEFKSPAVAAAAVASTIQNTDQPKRIVTVKEIVLEEGRKVQCEVEVISWRERKIKGQVTVGADVSSVWSVITDYERLSEFIPNLISSGKIPCPYPGRIWLEQIGFQRSMYWHIEARVVLDLKEFSISATQKGLNFSMVDGDFKKFDGRWFVTSGSRPGTTVLSYEVNVVPKFNLPAIFLEKIITSDLPVNLNALASWAEREFTSRKVDKIENGLSLRFISPHVLNNSLQQKNEVSSKDLKQSIVGTNFVQPPSPKEINGSWGVFGKVCKVGQPSMVDEVHLRRFDGLLENGGVHRCVIASITVKAPVREVWNVLTAYESLPGIVPNLAISKILSRKNNEVRVLQEGCKGLLYMVLHAKVVLDLREHYEQEISFEQVEGDFDSFKGSWSLEQLGSHHTLLKYSVESKMHKDTLLSEAIMEEVIYEDLPSNLCAIRDHIEGKMSICSSEAFKSKTLVNCLSKKNDTNTKGDELARPPNPLKHRSRVPGLQKEIDVLKSELQKFISEHGQEGLMPMRKQLRLHGRVDIEKAITRMGGFRRIAMLMNLSPAYKQRKPKGYWDNFENLQEEINRFQRNWGIDPSLMPSRKAFERAGRYDIARALEKWGGLHEVSRLLALQVRHSNRQTSILNDERSDSLVDAEFSAASKSTDFKDNHKWVLDFKELNLN